MPRLPRLLLRGTRADEDSSSASLLPAADLEVDQGPPRLGHACRRLAGDDTALLDRLGLGLLDRPERAIGGLERRLRLRERLALELRDLAGREAVQDLERIGNHGCGRTLGHVSELVRERAAR